MQLCRAALLLAAIFVFALLPGGVIADDGSSISMDLDFWRGKKVALHTQSTLPEEDNELNLPKPHTLYLDHGIRALASSQLSSGSLTSATSHIFPGIYGATKFSNESIFSEWDVVIIEGWVPQLTRFIAAVRDGLGKKQPLILYYCLDVYDEFYFKTIQFLNVDGYLTNSATIYKLFSAIRPRLCSTCRGCSSRARMLQWAEGR